MILLKLLTLGFGKLDCLKFTLGASEKSAREGPSKHQSVEEYLHFAMAKANLALTDEMEVNGVWRFTGFINLRTYEQESF